jgi:tripartite-type tricarboxylate transporter receptor subunit TctC
MNLFSTRRHTLCALAVGLAMAPCAWAQGQEFPNRPITIIVPYPAGGIVDSVTRVLAEQLTRELGQQVNVDPRPGGNANIGTQAGLRAAPDGYTWTFAATALTANPSMYKGLWDPLKDAVGVGVAVTAPSLLAVSAALPVNTVKELVELATKQPGKLNFGNPGVGASQHLNYEMFRQRADIQMTSIPYKGQPPVLQDMIRGEVQFSLFSVGIAAPQLTAGKIKALAVVSDTRVPALPDVPTLAEAGYPSANLVPWYGYVVPAATPRPVVARINQAINAALQVPHVQARLRAMGTTPQAPRSVEQINAMIRTDYETFRAAILAGNITAE